ncbi:MAG: hypothetical protein ACR2HG_14530 [Pyrinomonadaceae bacterium]
MCCKGFIKRVAPFFLTFAVGLFIASFFVSIAAPTFQIPNRGWQRHEEYHRRLEFENQRLQEENYRLKKQIADEDSQDFSTLDLKYPVPPPPLPPVPSLRIKADRNR